MTHVTCRLTSKNSDQLRNPTLGNRVWATFTFFTFFSVLSPYDNAKVAIDLRLTSNLQNILRMTQGFSSVRFTRRIVRWSEAVFVNYLTVFPKEIWHVVSHYRKSILRQTQDNLAINRKRYFVNRAAMVHTVIVTCLPSEPHSRKSSTVVDRAPAVRRRYVTLR